MKNFKRFYSVLKTPNVDFYSNKLVCQPDKVYLDHIHKTWFGDYEKLEVYHGYIQCKYFQLKCKGYFQFLKVKVLIHMLSH